MVGISDIPCVGKAVDRVSDATFNAVFRGLRYLLCFNSIINNLTSEIEKVNVQEDLVSRKAVAERADGKTILDHVTKWQKDVQDIKSRADGLSKQRPSWNPLTRFRMGRKAAHEAKNVADLTLSGGELLINEIAYLPADVNVPITDTAYQAFDSREEAYKKVWEALVKEDGHPIIGIYGMPGVGKTRMMEKAWEDAKDKKVFDKVTRANVGGEKVDVIKLQNQLAGYLGCHFESEDNEVRRASQLRSSLVNGGKTLVVLDDVWELIPLQKIGIPVGNDIPKGCKILLTSRKENICLHNDCKDPIKIESLKIDEAWDMFMNTVGILKIDSLEDKALARKVCKECAGLPLLIRASGNALKFVSEHSWKDALYQLENCYFEEIDGIEPAVYNCIKLSFDKLPEAEKTCLLLCSLFREDAEIRVKMLEDLATASQLLNRGRNVRGLVDNLKSSSLLLDGKTDSTVKLHDVIRDVARSVAVRDQLYAFLFIREGSLIPNTVNYRTRRLLQVVESDDFQCPTSMVCPDLHTLWLECNNEPPKFSESFFRGMGNLKILLLKGTHAFREKICAQSFEKLNCLIIEGCALNETWFSIVPESLETLRISKCYLPNPLDLSKLKSLRKLELVCHGEIKIVENAISALPPTLVELHIPRGFRICDAEVKISSSPISWELNKLSRLRSLSIRLEDSKSCPNESVVANLHDFDVDVGKGWYSYDSNYNRAGDLYKRSVMFKNTCIEGGGEVLVERAEEVIVNNVKGSANGFSNSRRQAFSTLKTLDIRFCDEMEHVVAFTPQNEIQPLSSFSQLTRIEIYSCRGLKYLFSASVAECLVQLKELYISNCRLLEAVVIRMDDGEIINFPKLKDLKLYQLPSLTRFYGKHRGLTTIMENASGSDCIFDEMVVFPSLEDLEIKSQNKSAIWGKNCCNNNSFGQLKSLTIERCDNLEYAIPLAMLPAFQNLEKLDIRYCDSMTTEVESSSSSKEELPPPVPVAALRDIHLSALPSLTSCSRNLYPNLEHLEIGGCKSLKNVFLPSIAKHLLRLQKLYVWNCEKMSEIIGEEEKEGERINEYVFPELTHLQLEYLPNFKSFCFSGSTEAPQYQSHMASKVSFPKLAVLEFIVKSIKLEEIEVGRNDSSSEITEIIVKCYNKVQLPSKWQLLFPNTIRLSLSDCRFDGTFCIFHNRCTQGGGESSERHEEALLLNVKGSPNGFSNSNREAFSNMTNLSIESCEGMDHVACTPYYKIQQNLPNTSFSKLTQLTIYSCPGLKYLFSACVAKCLVELQQLHILNCRALEVVIRMESAISGVIIKFPKLKELFLADLQSLRSFCGENRIRSSSSTTMMDNTDASTAGSETLFDGMVTFPALKQLQIQSLKTSEIWERNWHSNDSFRQLNCLKIKFCHNLEFAIPLVMLPTFQNLEKLDIADCRSMSSEVECGSSNECSNDEMPLVALSSVYLYSMPVLRQTRLNFRRGNLYPNLKTLDMKEL